MIVDVEILRVGGHAFARPEYAREHDAGFDLRAVSADWVTGFTSETLTLQPGESARFGCGFAFGLPPGLEMQVRPRSGLSGDGILCQFGTVDAGFRGEVAVFLLNLGSKPYVIVRGERIAQGVLAPVLRATFREVKELDATERGTNGFGSTGKG